MMSGVPILAAFVWPALFYGGAAAVSLPILIHLLARRRFKRIRWAAIEFLLQAQRRNRRRIRLEELILLLLRCLAVLLIALLISRPFIRPESLAALLGGADRTERIFIIDDSFSMGYRSGNESSFDRAKRAVIQLVKLLREQSPRDTVTVLRTSAIQSPVSAGVFLDQRQIEELSARIEGLQVSQQAMSTPDIFQGVRRMLDEQPDTISVTVYVVSDFQRKDWVDSGVAETDPPAPGAADASPIAPLAGWQSKDRGLKLVLVDVGDDRAQNVAITGLESERSRFVAGVAASVSAGISNFSQSTQPLDLDVAVGPLVQATVTVPEVHPGDTTKVSLPVTIVRPGWQQVRVAVPRDALPIDDERTLVVEAVEAVKTLIVNGEPSSDTYRDEVALLQTAVRPPGEVFSGNDVIVIDETELEDTDFGAYDVVMLANVYRISEAVAEALARFTFEGGGVVFFLGDQVDADWYNATLYAKGRGLLPARLDEPRTAPASGVRLMVDDALHPMVRVYGGRDNAFVKQILFRQYFACTVADGGDEGATELTPGSQPGGLEGQISSLDRSKVVAHFDDSGATPAVIERAYGAGRVILFTSSCDLEWNDWGRDPSFVVSMLELTQHLARGRGGQTDLLVGSPIELSIDPGRFDSDVRVRTPGYPAEREISVTATPVEDAATGASPGFRVRWERTQVSGVYQFVLTSHTGEEEIRAVAVNVDPAESDLTAAVEADLRQSLHELPFTYVAGLESLDEAGEEARRELWRTVLAAVLVVLMVEQFLAWWFGRRA